MDDRLKVTVISGTSLASSRKTYCEVQVVSTQGTVVGKPLRTRFCNKTSNPQWDQELIFPVLSFGGFVLSVWEHHTLFRDKCLGVLTIQFNEEKLKAGGELLNDSFTLSKSKPKDIVSGKIHLSVQYGTGAKVPKTHFKDQPAELKEPAISDTRQHRPLRVSSKWGLSKSIEAQRAFVVVEEDSIESDDESSKTDSKVDEPVETVAKKPSGKRPPRSPRSPKVNGGAKKTKVTKPTASLKPEESSSSSDSSSDSETDSKIEPTTQPKITSSEEIDWNGSSGKKTGRGALLKGKKGGSTTPIRNSNNTDEEIDWNGSKGKSPKRTGVTSDEPIDWNGSKPKKASTPKTPKASAKTMKIREQIAEVIRLCSAEGSIVVDCRKDDAENLEFSLRNPTTGALSPVTLIIPESVRRGEFLLFTEDGVVELGAPGTIFRAMAKVLQNYAEYSELDSYQPLFPKDVETPNSDTDTPEPMRNSKKAGRAALLDSFQDMDFSSTSSLADTSSNLIRFTEEFENLHGKQAFGLYKFAASTNLRFSFKPSSILSDLMAEIWLIDNSQSIVVELQVPFNGQLPKVSLYQTTATNLNVENPPSSTFGLRWYLQKRLERYLGKNWPPTASNHLFLDMMTYAIDKIMVCTKTCVICDTPLTFEMLKPSICDSSLCLFSSEQYGLGQDVSAMLHHNPEVFDLLISATASIVSKAVYSSNDGKRFSPFPSAIEVDVGGTICTFSKGSNPDYAAVSAAIKAFPSVADMATYPNSASLKAALDAKNPMSFPLLRWILTSNRTHLAKLKPDQLINAIPTPHQYLMLSATPARERIFQQRKKEYGSFLAFHGSGFFNWHAILRTGLRNLSGTDLMSTGAVYGNGVYLAAESGTSIGYAGTHSGWEKSSHGTSGEMMRCMALCEVINAGYKANPYYVIPKEEDIVTRYLFIFDSAQASAMQSSTIQAASIQLPKTSFDQLLSTKGK